MNSRATSNPALIVVVAILVASAVGFSTGLRAYGIHLHKSPIYAPGGRTVASIPTETESWKRIGADQIMPAEVIDELGTDNYLSRIYIQKSPVDPNKPHAVELHLAYYTGTIDTVPHVPERCFVGGGLQIGQSSRSIPLDLDQTGWIEDQGVPEGLRGHIFTARTSNRYSDLAGGRVRLPRDPQGLSLLITGFKTNEGRDFFSGYFFIANGGAVARAEGVRALAFQLSDDYAYYLKVQVTSRTAGTREELAELTSSLLGELLVEVMRCVPDWVEVQAGRYPVEVEPEH